MGCSFMQQQENDGGVESQVPTAKANEDSNNAFTSFIDSLTVI